ncbi:MAG TPA: helix-turn-helix transcriptional regulator [Symbiobacteriaceae bacterium]|jgi:transcriptional regulator with XRE-family HTH domain
MLVDDASGLPRRIRQLRMELGWSLEDLARAMETAKGTVSNWEAVTDRQRVPPIGSLLALARWFGVSMDYLCGVPGADRDSPQVRKGKAALRERFPLDVKTLPVPTAGARLRLAVAILQELAPEAFWPARIAANLLMTPERLTRLLEEDHPPEAVLERFARITDMPGAWFVLRPTDI